MNKPLRLITFLILSLLTIAASGQELHVFVIEAQSGDSIPFANAV